MYEQIEQYLMDHPRMLGAITELITNIPWVDVEGDKNIYEAREWLKRGSIILYFVPHTSIWDPLIVTERVIRGYITNQPFFWIGSTKFTREFEEFEDLGLASISSIECAPRMNFTFLSVVQPYLWKRLLEKLRNDPEKKATMRQKVRDLNTQSLTTATEELGKPGTLVAISIEGTRETEGGLLVAQHGIEQLLDIEGTLALPITLRGVHRMQPVEPNQTAGLSGLNPLIRARARVGELISKIQAQELATHYQWPNGKPLTVPDALMMHAARGGLETIRERIKPLGVYADVMRIG